jgi:predicted PurR-regulated permease PerM
MSALGEYIPYVGPFISGALIVIVAFLQSPTKALIAIGFALALQQLEGSIIAPNVMHPQTKISPLTTLFVVFAGWSVGGALGALVAIPIAAAIRVLIMQLVVPAVRRQTGAVANGATEPEREEAA